MLPPKPNWRSYLMAKRRKNRQSEDTGFMKTRQRVEINPINENQREYLRSINNHDITFGVGPAGTGKTYLATLMAMQAQTEGLVDRIVICRPAVNADDEDLGFLPGGINQKMDPYVRPIFDAFRTYWSQQTINDYIGRGIIEISPLAYMRGRTFKNTFIVCDEFQNATDKQLLMLLTRLGDGSKMVITGDPCQSDVNGRSCLVSALETLSPIDTISFVTFKIADVVRHPTVKKVIRAYGAVMDGGDEETVVPIMMRS